LPIPAISLSKNGIITTGDDPQMVLMRVLEFRLSSTMKALEEEGFEINLA
jgi:hypothetical protein